MGASYQSVQRWLYGWRIEYLEIKCSVKDKQNNFKPSSEFGITVRDVSKSETQWVQTISSADIDIDAVVKQELEQAWLQVQYG